MLCFEGRRGAVASDPARGERRRRSFVRGPVDRGDARANASFIPRPLSLAAAWQSSASRPQMPPRSSRTSAASRPSRRPPHSPTRAPEHPRERRYSIWKPSSHDTRLEPVPAASAYAATDASSATVGNDGDATPP